MEHNNIYVYHRGVGESVLAKPILFVFPFTATLTSSDMSSFLTSELNKKVEMAQLKTKVNRVWIGQYVLERSIVQHESKRTIMFAHPNRGAITLEVRPRDKFLAQYSGHRKNSNVKSKMDEMIKFYENTVTRKLAREVESQLEARDIIYYDAQKTVGAPNFDKRSPEGKAIIQAKRVVQREKLLAQRGYSINAKRREVSIGMSRLELQDN